MCERRSQAEALYSIRRCLTEGDFVESAHFRARLSALTEERGVSILDVMHIGQHGGIYCEPEFDTKHGEWNYRIEGTSPDGLLVAVVFSFKADDFAMLITIFILQ
jgi:hypothetical protein